MDSRHYTTPLGTICSQLCSEGHYLLVKKLIEAKADVNSEDDNGQTALFYSAQRGKREVCELLIQSGAIVNKQDRRRQTPLSLAKKSSHYDVPL